MKDQIVLTNWKQALSTAKLDPAVGIRIAPLTENKDFAMYVAEILPNKKVGAHFHREGIEIYSIFSGNGILYTAVPNQRNEPTDIQSKAVSEGDFFNINAGIIHQLKNIGKESLILVFGCPDFHLSSDRTIIIDLDNSREKPDA